MHLQSVGSLGRLRHGLHLRPDAFTFGWRQVAQVGDRFGRAFGRQQVFAGPRPREHVGDRKNLARERIQMLGPPVAVHVPGVVRLTE